MGADSGKGDLKTKKIFLIPYMALQLESNRILFYFTIFMKQIKCHCRLLPILLKSPQLNCVQQDIFITILKMAFLTL